MVSEADAIRRDELAAAAGTSDRSRQLCSPYLFNLRCSALGCRKRFVRQNAPALAITALPKASQQNGFAEPHSACLLGIFAMVVSVSANRAARAGCIEVGVFAMLG